MPTWGEQLKELRALKEEAAAKPPVAGAPSPHDKLRRKYLKELYEHTGRAVIFYGTCWLENKQGIAGESLSVTLGDKQGFMEVVSNISERELDLILTSPGGSPEAAESIMNYLRSRFDHIRAVIPVAAMSAATMMALACDEILMGTHSQDLVLSVHHAARHTFNDTGTTKLIENHLGRAYLEMQGQVIVGQRPGQPVQPVPTNPPKEPPAAPPRPAEGKK